MANRSAEFASLLCSRLCLDLTSSVGMLNNGIEQLAEETDGDALAFRLTALADSARTAANRLKFFKLAFGATGGFGEVVATRDAQAAIEGLHATDRRIRIGWMVGEDALARVAIKVLLNLALIAGDALVQGGQLDIGAEGNEIVIRAEGPHLALDPEIRNALLGEADQDLLSPRASVAWLVHLLVADGGGNLVLSQPDRGVLLLGVTLRG